MQGAGKHDVFISYSRADRNVVLALTERLKDAGKRAWVDLDDIPASAEWMAEIRGAIDAADGYLTIISPDLAISPICSEELAHATTAGKRVVPVSIRPTDPDSVPEGLSRLNWIDATDGDLAAATIKIVQALDTDLDRVKAHTRLLVRATEWDRQAGDRSALLRGRELANAEALIGDIGREPGATQLQTRFVLASRKASGRRQRTVVAATCVALVVALVLGALAYLQREEATDQRAQALDQRDLARSSGLASSALATLRQDPELSLLLSLEGASVRRTDRVELALREALNTSNVQFVFRAHDAMVGDLSFSPDGQTIASVGYDNRILFWDATTGEVRQTIKSHNGILPLTFDPRGSWIAGGVSGGVLLWDPASGDRIGQLDLPGTVYQVETTPTGNRLIATGDGGVRVWRTDTWETELAIPTSRKGTYAASLSPSGDMIATANGDGSVELLDSRTGHRIALLDGHDDLASWVQFDPSGERLLSLGFDRTVRVWDVQTGDELNRLTHDHLIRDAEFVGRDYVVTMDAEAVGRVWDLVSGGVASELRGHSGIVNAVVVGPKRDRVASVSEDGTVRLWRLGPGVSHLEVHRKGFVWAAEYAAGDSILTAGDSGQVEAWAEGSSEFLNVVFEQPGDATVLDVSAREDIAAVAYRRERDGSVIAGGVAFVDSLKGTRTSLFKLENSGYPLSVSLDASGGSAIGVWSDGHARVTDADGGLIADFPIASPPTDRLGDSLAELFPNGARAAIVNNGHVDIVDVATGRVERTLTVIGVPILTLAVSPDGTHVATGMNDSTVRIWDADTGAQTGELRGHSSYLASVDFSPDGSYVVSGALDGTARVWTLEGREIQRIQAAEFIVTTTRFSADGTHILVGGLTGSRPVPVSIGYDPPHGGVVRIYDCDVCRTFDGLVELAHSRVTRQLSATERGTYLDGASSNP